MQPDAASRRYIAAIHDGPRSDPTCRLAVGASVTTNWPRRRPCASILRGASACATCSISNPSRGLHRRPGRRLPAACCVATTVLLSALGSWVRPCKARLRATHSPGLNRDAALPLHHPVPETCTGHFCAERYRDLTPSTRPTLQLSRPSAPRLYHDSFYPSRPPEPAIRRRVQE